MTWFPHCFGPQEIQAFCYQFDLQKAKGKQKGKDHKTNCQILIKRFANCKIKICSIFIDRRKKNKIEGSTRFDGFCCGWFSIFSKQMLLLVLLTKWSVRSNKMIQCCFLVWLVLGGVLFAQGQTEITDSFQQQILFHLVYSKLPVIRCTVSKAMATETFSSCVAED